MSAVDRILFGVVIRSAEEEILDEVFDALEGAGFEDSDYEWISFLRGTSCYFVLYAPLLVRAAIVDGVRDSRIVPVATIAGDIADNRNEWIEPRPSSRNPRPAVELAQERLEEWQRSVWRHELGTPEVDVVEEEPIVDLSRRRERANRGNAGRSEARADVLRAFGLLGATDSEGKNFTFTTLATPEDQADEAATDGEDPTDRY